jgi:hypothetical protein
VTTGPPPRVFARRLLFVYTVLVAKSRAKGTVDTVRSDAFVNEIKAEFPGFEIVPKRQSRLQRAIGVALRILTFGGQTSYMARYHTAMFGKLWVPDSYEQMADDDRYILLRHERVHLRQRARMGGLAMAFVYLVPFFPLGLAYGRARIEWEAYRETILATAEIRGLTAARDLRPMLLDRFTGPDYGWMWPFPSSINAWIDEALAALPPFLLKDTATNIS